MAQGSSSTDVVSIIGDQALNEPIILKERYDAVLDTLDKIVATGKQLGTNGQGLVNAISAQSQLIQLQRDSNRVTEESKRIKSEEKELNRLIAEEEKAARKAALADERELTRLIKIEARERAKEESDAIKQANRDKAESDKAYIAHWKRLLKEKADAEREANKISVEEAKRAQQAAIAAVDPTSLKAMSARLDGLREGYSRLTAAERENAEIGGVVLARIKELDAALKASDAEQGKFTRNVGNYASAYSKLDQANANFSRSLGQITGEFTNLAYGAKTFFSSLSNNIGPAILEFKNFLAAVKAAKLEAVANAEAQGLQAAATAAEAGASEEAAASVGELAKEQALAAAEGQKGASALKAIGKALLSFQTLISVAVALLTVFGPKIYDAFMGNTEASKKAAEANKKYKESLEQIEESQQKMAGEELIRLQLLTRAATDTASSTQKRQHAVDELQKLYPNYLGNIDDEAIKSGKAADSIDVLTKAILANAAAKASAEKYGASYNRVQDLQRLVDEAGAKYGQAFRANQLAQANQNNRQPSDLSFVDAERGQDPVKDAMNATAAAVKSAKTDFDNLRKQLHAARIEMFGFANDAQKAADAVPDLFSKPVKDKEGKSSPDYTNEELKAEVDLTQSLFKQFKQRTEQAAKEQKAIAEDETNNLQKRVDAYDAYTLKLLDLAGAESAAEQEVIRTKLNKIAEIEKKAVDKRTNEEKRLLLSKEALEVDLTTATEAYSAKRTDIVNQGAKLQSALLKQYGKEALGNAATETGNFNSVGQFFKGSAAGPTQTRQQFEEEQKKRYEAFQFYARQSIAVEQELLGIIQDANNAKINAIDSEIEKLKERGDVERKEILASGKTEAEQKQLLASLDARQANDEFQLNEKKRQQQLRNARFEKAAAIARLIQDSSLAILSVYKDPSVPTVAKLPLAIGIGALAAAQIARAIAAPLPQYKDGTPVGGHPSDSWAIVGDGGRKEVVETSEGTFLSPARSTPVFLRKGDVVHKSVEEYINRAQVMSMNGIPALRPISEHVSTKKMEGKLERIARGIDRLNDKEIIKLTNFGLNWGNFTSDIYH